MTEFKGRLFAGKLFAGRLFRGPSAQVGVSGKGGGPARTRPMQRAVAPRIRRDRDDDVLMFLLRK